MNTNTTPNAKPVAPELQPPPNPTNSPDAGFGIINDYRATARRQVEKPETDKNAVIMVAGTRGPAGAPEIESLAGRRFDRRNIGFQEAAETALRSLLKQISGLEEEAEPYNSELRKKPAVTTRRMPCRPYTKFEKLKIGLLAGIMALFLAMSCAVLYVNVVGSGQPGTDNPFIALLFCPLALMVLAAFEMLSRQMPSDAARQRYQLIITIAGMCFLLCYVMMFSQVFPGFAQDPRNFVKAALSGTDQSPQWWRAFYLASQLFAEGLLTASCFMEIMTEIRNHSADVTGPNPDRVPLQKEIDRIERECAELRKVASDLAGRLKELATARAEHIQESLMEFHAFIVLAEQKAMRESTLERTLQGKG